MWKKQHELNIRRRRSRLADEDEDDDDAVARADALAEECRDRLIDSVRSIAERTTTSSGDERKLGILLSGGVDSTAILEACRIAGGIPLRAAVTVSIVADDDDDDECCESSPSSSARDYCCNDVDDDDDDDDEAVVAAAASESKMIPQDELYATEAARIYNNDDDDGDDGDDAAAAPPVTRMRMHHSVVTITPGELVRRYSRPVIRALAVWGYMETRNSLIMSAAFDECRRLGLTDVLTGDNADELLGGSYDWYFKEAWADDPEGWIEKRNETADLPFATNEVAKAFGIELHQPFRDVDRFVNWAMVETGRADCVDARKICRLQSEFGGPYYAPEGAIHNCGKLPLREAFQTVASWRTMDWIFRGSGAAGAGASSSSASASLPPLVEHYRNLYTDDEFEEERERYETTHNVVLRSKEHLHNIRIFLEVFGGFENHPTKERYPVGDPRGCVSCLYDVGDEQFCHLCDEYPARPPDPHHHPRSTTTTTTTTDAKKKTPSSASA